MEIVVVIVIGLIAGGIVNVLADDLPYRRSIGTPTYPDGTSRPLTAWLGITAFLLGQREPVESKVNTSRARVHIKGNKLGWRYPLTELLTIFLMVVAFIGSQDIPQISRVQQVFYLVYMAIFALITVIDIEHKLILFVVTIPAIVLGILDAILIPEVGPALPSALIGGAIGFGVFFAMYLGGFAFNNFLGRMRGQEINTTAFGYGDVMLITFSGVLLGFDNIFFALFITVFLGAGGAIIYLIAKRLLSGRYRAFQAIPYGPYIVAGTIIILLYSYPVQCAIWHFSIDGRPCF